MRSARVLIRDRTSSTPDLPSLRRAPVAPALASDPIHGRVMPRTRDGLLVNDLRDETLVFDPATLRAHGLSAPTSLAFRYCDGRTPCRRVAARLAAAIACDDPWELLWLILDALAARRLIEPVAMTIDGEARREFLRKTSQVAALLPLISSVAAPAPARPGHGTGVSR